MLYPSRAERTYQKDLIRAIKKIATETNRQLSENKLYKLDASLDDVIMQILAFANEVMNGVVVEMPGYYALVNQWHDRQWRLIVKANTNLDIPAASSLPLQRSNISDLNEIKNKFGLGVDVYRLEPWLAEAQTRWVANNSSLIKTITPQYMQRVEGIIRNSVLGGKTVKQLSEEVKEASNVSIRRARVIARDQISKANAELDMYRQKELGVKQYRWRTSLDERVRPSHKAKQGMVFNWNNPPSDTGHPGHDVMCRCRAEPVF